jgi:hypothetical protein
VVTKEESGEKGKSGTTKPKGPTQTEFQSSAAYATDDWKETTERLFTDLLDQVPYFVCDVTGHGAHVAGNRTHPRRYVAGPVYGLLIDLGGVFAEIAAGVLDVITGIFQVTSKLLAGFFTGLGSINESSGRAGCYSEGENCPVTNCVH